MLYYYNFDYYGHIIGGSCTLNLPNRNQFFNINKNEVKIKITGLKKGEKLKEILSVSKYKIRTKFSNIYEYLEPNYPNYKINRLLNTLKYSLIKTNEKKSIMIIKKFLKKEIR